MLKDGRVEAEGTLETLLRTSEEMQHLWAGDPAFYRRDIADNAQRNELVWALD